MGDIYLELTVANIYASERQQEILFLVDTGATRAWIPQQVADDLGIQPAGTVPLELADGSVKELPYGFCLFGFDGETVAGNVVIGPPECEPVVGTHVLQDFRFVIDMERHTISRGRAMRAKGALAPHLRYPQLKLRSPIAVSLEDDGVQIIAVAYDLDVFGYGETEGEALDDLRRTITDLSEG